MWPSIAPALIAAGTLCSLFLRRASEQSGFKDSIRRMRCDHQSMVWRRRLDFGTLYRRLMSDACRRRFDAVLVWKIDRFGRSLKHLVNALAELAALGVAFISLRDNLDLSTPSGRLMFQIIGAMAEFERALIQERVRAGIRNARAKGQRLGRPRVVVDASRIASLRVRGNSWSQIQAELGMSKGTAQRAFAGLRP
jgi:DNA invertase Pin-like site-specific DNA recombinase